LKLTDNVDRNLDNVFAGVNQGMSVEDDWDGLVVERRQIDQIERVSLGKP
jgi:hypothetical protein